MRKIIVSVVFLLIAVSFIGCGKRESVSENTTAKPDEVTEIVSTETTAQKVDKPKWTKEQKRIYAIAKDLVFQSQYSREEIMEVMTTNYGQNEFFSKEEATFALDQMEAHKEVDWNEQALKTAKGYIASDLFDYTKDEIYEQLVKANHFTESQAKYAIDNLEVQ